MKETPLILKLNKESSKELNTILKSKASKQIIQELEKKKNTISGLSKSLKLPLSTVQYNIQSLEKLGIISSEEFHYSEKGRTVPHYSLKKSFVLLSFTEGSFSSLMQKFLPITLLAVVVSWIISILQTQTTLSGSLEKATFAARETAIAAQDTVVEETVQHIPTATASLNPGLLFFLGAFLIILIFLFLDIKKQRESF